MVHKIGERIQKNRKLQGLSQEELSENLNVSRQTISKWENGDNLPDVFNLIAISRIFNVSIDELLLGTPSLLYSKSIIDETRKKRSRFLFFGRMGLLVISLLLTPPLILMDALGVTNPTFGIVASVLLSIIGITTFVVVYLFTKAIEYKNELVYLEKIKHSELSNDSV